MVIDPEHIVITFDGHDFGLVSEPSCAIIVVSGHTVFVRNAVVFAGEVPQADIPDDLAYIPVYDYILFYDGQFFYVHRVGGNLYVDGHFLV